MSPQNEWRQFTHQQIYDMVWTGPGAEVVVTAETAWAQYATALSAVEERLHRTIRDVGAGWEGQAADAMTTATTPLGTWAFETAEKGRQAALALRMQSDLASHTRHEMPEPVAPGVAPPATFPGDDPAVRQAQDELRAKELMENYAWNVSDAFGVMVDWSDPPAAVMGTGTGVTPAAGPERALSVGDAAAGPGGAGVGGGGSATGGSGVAGAGQAGSGLGAWGGTGPAAGGGAGAGVAGGGAAGAGAAGAGASSTGGTGAGGTGVGGPGGTGAGGPGGTGAGGTGTAGVGGGGPGAAGMPGAVPPGGRAGITTGDGPGVGGRPASSAAGAPGTGRPGVPGQRPDALRPGARPDGPAGTGRGPGTGGSRPGEAYPGTGRPGAGPGPASRPVFDPADPRTRYLPTSRPGSTPVQPPAPTNWRDMVRANGGFTDHGPGSAGRPPVVEHGPRGSGTPTAPASTTAPAPRAAPGTGHPGMMPMAGSGAGAGGETRRRAPYLLDDTGMFDVEHLLHFVPPVILPPDHPDHR